MFSSGDMFVLSASPASTTAVNLAWTAFLPTPDTYRIERSTDGISFSTVTSAAADVFSYQDTGRTESVQYWYRIVPILGGVDQPASNVADTWTVPATPTGLTATAISSTQINLAWTDVSTGNTAQSIQRRSPAGSGSYSFIASVGATANSYSDTGLIAATQYEYQVAATNPATQSAWSTAANATTTGGGPPSASWTLDFSTGEPWANGTNYVFSSMASTSRTFVNSSGYVALSVANLLLQSQDFTTTWSNTNTTDSSNTATAPDGTTTADTLTESAGTSVVRRINQNLLWSSGVTYTISVYAKADTATCLQIAGDTAYVGTDEWATFDLSNGTIGSVGTAVTGSDATIENIGSGWYRCKLTILTTAAAGSAPVLLALTNNTATTTRLPTYTVTAGNERGLYLWGAQMVTGSAALPYSATTTSTNGIPRLTHNSSGSRLGLLVEGQRANLVFRSEDLTTTWTNTNTTETGNAATAPDNNLTADELIESAATTVNRFISSNLISFTSGVTYTASVYAKANSATCMQIFLGSAAFGSGAWATFNVSAGTVGSVGATVTTADRSITDVGNGWYRCTLTQTATGTSNQSLALCLTNNTATTTRAPTYTVTAGNERGLYLWGAQFEVGATVSSYIPTVASSVTRQADIAYVETADVTNWGRPGSFVVEYYKPTGQSGGVVVADDDGAGNAGRLGVEYSAGSPRIVYGTSGSGSGGTDTAGLNKIGWAWDGSGAATRSALNGSALDTSLATSFDPTLTDGINLGGNIDWTAAPLTVSGQPNVVIRRVRFWNSQLSAADLNTLTT